MLPLCLFVNLVQHIFNLILIVIKHTESETKVNDTSTQDKVIFNLQCLFIFTGLILKAPNKILSTLTKIRTSWTCLLQILLKINKKN